MTSTVFERITQTLDELPKLGDIAARADHAYTLAYAKSINTQDDKKAVNAKQYIADEATEDLLLEKKIADNALNIAMLSLRALLQQNSFEQTMKRVDGAQDEVVRYGGQS